MAGDEPSSSEMVDRAASDFCIPYAHSQLSCNSEAKSQFNYDCLIPSATLTASRECKEVSVVQSLAYSGAVPDKRLRRYTHNAAHHFSWFGPSCAKAGVAHSFGPNGWPLCWVVSALVAISLSWHSCPRRPFACPLRMLQLLAARQVTLRG